MNILFHFLFNYWVVDHTIGNAAQYKWFILAFSTFIDLDHIPYIISIKGDLIRKKFGSASRTRLHELYGLTIFSVAFSIFSFFYDPILAKVMALCIVLHLGIDFIIGRTRPFYPFSKQEVFLRICPDKYRIPLEIIATLIFGVLVWPIIS